MANNQGILREKRDLPPAHYTVEIKSYTQLFNSTAGLERFESGIFVAGPYKWRLVFYPNGNKKDGGDGHISLYLAMDKSNAFSDDWSVYVNYKLFVQDRLLNNYLAIHDAKGPIRRFDKNKTEWGFAKFLNLDTFIQPLNGYLVNDSCVFGAEVFVIESTGKGESISILKDPPVATHSWKIKNFSKLNEFPQTSDIYIIGDRKWRMKLHPLGEMSIRGKSISLYLMLADFKSLPPLRAVYAEYKLRLVDQLRKVNSFERKYNYWFGKLESWGHKNFITLKDLHNVSKGYVVDDTVTIELQFLSISVVKLD